MSSERHPTDDRPVVVVGGSLAGMAAAARLAKVGHRVELFEARDRLGGSWAAYEVDGVLVDDAPSIVGFPAPWRDLFRKSGRPLEAELARSGHALVPALPTRYRFADGTELVLPVERGEAYAVLSRAYGTSAAEQWRDLVDHLDDVWQALRPLGLEAELRDPRQLKPVRSLLRPRRSLRRLAAQVDEPHLAAIVNSVAHRLGSTPDRTPGWCAVELSTLRTFGRWQLDSEALPSDRGRTSVLVEALAARLALRRVRVHLGQRVTGIELVSGRAGSVTTADGDRVPAAAVLCTIDPWTTVTELLPADVAAPRRRLVRRLQPASAPAVSHAVLPGEAPAVTETITLTAAGVPIVEVHRPSAAGTTLHTVHDFTRAQPQPSAGVAWRGHRSWLDRPGVTTGVPGLFLAGPFSPAGAGGSQVVLSGALASYAVHDLLGASP